jgi:hypothetical protein
MATAPVQTLSLDDITGILGSTRSKTNAGEYVQDFLSSGELGREVDLNAGSFAGKDAKTVKTALDNARKKVNDETGALVVPGGTDVQVRIKQETNGKKGKDKEVLSEKLFIINTKLVAEARAKQS